MLRAAFPRLTADVNSLYAPYSAQSDQVVSLPQPDYAQRMIGWRASESCGAGFRIGMIDMAPGPSPALSGQKLHLQSFLDQGKQAFDNGHGTAIASLLIGHGVAGRAEAADVLADAIACFVDARKVRAEVLKICKAVLETEKLPNDEKYWVLASAAEAYLGIGDEQKAAETVAQASEVAPKQWMRDSTREQMDRLRALLADSPLRHIAAVTS